jgi:two-component system, OmpR family, alkaline phosphatase synthesis response regulator PhoP
VRKTAFHFECRESLADLLARADGHELPLSAADELVDGDWLLVSFALDEQRLSLAGRVVEHTTPEGSRFGVELAEHDFERLLGWVDDEAPDSEVPPSRQTRPEAVTPPPGTEVMVVHDDADVVLLLTQMLRQSGFSVAQATTSRDAIAQLESSNPHIVLADWSPGGAGSAELCRALAARPRRPSLVFLACPSCRGDRERALEAGADDFVVLPFRYRELGVRLLSLVQR